MWGRKGNRAPAASRRLNDHLFEGRYSPIWPDGTQHSRNVYAHTREECEEKLKALIAEMNEERKNLKEQLAGIAPPEKLTKEAAQAVGLYAPPPGGHGVLDPRQTNRPGTEYGEEALWDGSGDAGKSVNDE